MPRVSDPATKPHGWTAERTEANVITVRVPMQTRTDWEQTFLLSGDRHWDNPHSDHDLQKVHLNQAAERNAGIIDIGDFFCAMQGRYDKRKDRRDIRPEHNVPDYLNALSRTAADFFEPWAHWFILIGTGNHEQKILKHQEVDLLADMVGRLNDRTGSAIQKCGFGGWVRFLFSASGRDAFRQSINLHYDHGYGGGGAVTKGTIQSNRRAVYLPDAQLVVSGHVHEDWKLDLCRNRLSNEGVQYQDTQTHIVVPTYKEEYGDGSHGWHAERGAPPKPIGATWLTFRWVRRLRKVVWDVTKAH